MNFDDIESVWRSPLNQPTDAQLEQHKTLLLLIVHQLRAVGKAGDEILLPTCVIWPAYVSVIGAWFGWKYHRRLLPEKRQLEALAQSYQ